MFNIIRESLRPGIVTTSFPATPPEVSPRTRGRPLIDWPTLQNVDAIVASCPTAAFSQQRTADEQRVTFDLGRCTFCGLCAAASDAIRLSRDTLCAVRRREALVTTARYAASPDGSVGRFLGADAPPAGTAGTAAPAAESRAVEEVGRKLQEAVGRRFGRSLHIREVDAGSCNGCEIEIVNLTGPVYDLERFGIHFVASPRHADMLLVTGPVTRNMELALRKTYNAMPGPRLVVAVGTCGCSGGMCGDNYATCGAVDAVLAVDVYIPGCPPNPYALLQGILLAIDRWPGSP